MNARSLSDPITIKIYGEIPMLVTSGAKNMTHTPLAPRLLYPHARKITDFVIWVLSDCLPNLPHRELLFPDLDINFWNRSISRFVAEHSAPRE
jgi:hypothetical protein